jgi:CDGSH-type Zn-finger protein
MGKRTKGMARRVDLKDQSPLIIKADDLVNGSCAVCRCGLSGHWPMCDGTHKATIGEEPGKLYRYERELPQGTIKREEIGKLEMPGDGQKATDETAGQHDGAASHRPRRPERGVAAEGTRGNEAGAEGKSGAGDELLATPGRSEEAQAEGGAKPLATGGAEGILPKNRSGQGGESA